MKLKAVFEKEPDGKISAKLTCIDPEDFGDKFPFSTWLLTNVDSLKLSSMQFKALEGTFATSEKAVEAVERAVERIKELLKEWRNIKVPSERIYSV